MKLLGLVILFFAGSISLFAASESQQALSLQTAAGPEFKIGSLSLNSAGNVKPFFKWPGQDGYRATRGPAETTTCYKMRAYYMVRENGESDVMRPDGYSTCQTSSRFRVKSAIAQRRIEEKTAEPISVAP